MGESTIVHILITAVTIPIVLFLFKRFVDRSDKIKEKEEEQWRTSVKEMFSKLEKKLTDYCTKNSREHDEFYTARREMERRVGVIENTHHLKGCDAPMRKDMAI